jgi:hypothetical protein
VNARLATIVALLLLSGCADRTEPPPGAPDDITTTVEVVCRANGTTDLGSPTVAARPAGVHVVVRSHLKEPASVNGMGFDVEPGQTERTIALAPGAVEVSCWAFSDHGADEPPTQRLEVVDPRSLYTDPELDCQPGDMIGSTIADFVAPGPDRSVRIPLEEAEGRISGLLPDDRLAYGGYPEQTGAPVRVVRGGAVVASVSFARAVDGTWVSPGSTTCSSADLHVP